MTTFGVQAVEIARRLVKGFRLDGRINLAIDSLAVPSIAAIDLDQPAFRSDGITAWGSEAWSTADLIDIAIRNRSAFPFLINRLSVDNFHPTARLIEVGVRPASVTPAADFRLFTSESPRAGISGLPGVTAQEYAMQSTLLPFPGLIVVGRQFIAAGGFRDFIERGDDFAIPPNSELVIRTTEATSSGEVTVFGKVWTGS